MQYKNGRRAKQLNSIQHHQLHTKMFVELVDNRYAPVKGSQMAAGYDLCACISDAFVPPTHYLQQDGIVFHTSGEEKSISIKAGKRALIKTGVRMSLPFGQYGRIAPRSGLAYKNGIDVLAGVIDADYRGDVGVILLNTGDSDFIIKDGDRIAQIIIEKIDMSMYTLVESVKDLGITDRGEGGFGSTGV